jgi:hypothetical protein
MTSSARSHFSTRCPTAAASGLTSRLRQFTTAQHAQFIAFRIGEHNPCHLAGPGVGLADLDSYGSQVDQSVGLSIPVTPGIWSYVKVPSVFYPMFFVRQDQLQQWPLAPRILQCGIARCRRDHFPSGRRRPERRQRRRIERLQNDCCHRTRVVVVVARIQNTELVSLRVGKHRERDVALSTRRSSTLHPGRPALRPIQLRSTP